MKKLFVLFTLLILMVVNLATAQTTTTKADRVGNPESYMTADQLAEYYGDIKMAEIEGKMEKYGNWVGVGGEVGTAIKEGLTAVVEVADKFGGTDVGKFTMVMVAWKVIGEDVVRILLGIIFAIVMTVLIFRSVRHYYPRKYLVKGNRWKFWQQNEYELNVPETNEGTAFMKILHIALLMGSYGITYAIMFS